MAANQRPVIELVSDEPSPVGFPANRIDLFAECNAARKRFMENKARLLRAINAQGDVLGDLADQEELNLAEFQHNSNRIFKKDGNG